MKHLIPAVLLIFLVACKSEDKEKVAAPSVSPVTANPFAPAGSDGAGAILNPEHGKPGHRCDLDVGAPLPQSPTNNNVPATVAPITIPGNPETKSPVPTTIAPNTNTAATSAVTLNPQHGQPGHRCDIAVGAALPAKSN